MIGVTINQPLVVAQQQKIVVIGTNVNHEEEYVDIIYKILNENGEVVKTGTERFANPGIGESFWQEYAHKEDAYKELFRRLGINDEIPEIPDTLTNNVVGE